MQHNLLKLIETIYFLGVGGLHGLVWVVGNAFLRKFYRETQKPIDGLAPFASNVSQGMMSKADWGILMLWQTLYQLNKHD